MIHSLLVVVFTLSAPAGEAPSATSTVPIEQTAPPLRTGAELRQVIRDSMREWARVEEDQADEAARRLLALYTELRADAIMARAQREIYRMKLRGRLLALSRQITRRVAREEQLAERDGARPDRLDARAKPAPLAQMAPGFGRPGFGGGGGPAMGGFGGRPMGGGVGGAFGQLGAGGFGAPGTQANDNGQQLVEVIQATIAPQSWDVNGGPGAIRYWRPGQALIIRQTERGHEDVLNLLLQLRRAGG